MNQSAVSYRLKFWSLDLTDNEDVQICCAIAREQMAICNFEGARLILSRWLTTNAWPTLYRLDSHIAADFLFTLGTLVSTLSLTGSSVKGQRQAESYLNGAIAIFEHLGRRISAAECRVELGRCYFREGHLDESRSMLSLALSELPDDQLELRGQCVLLLGAVDRHAGRLRDSLSHLQKAFEFESGQIVTGRRHLEIATTLKELGDVEQQVELHEEAKKHFEQALFEFEAIGNHHNRAATANNFGNFLLSV